MVPDMETLGIAQNDMSMVQDFASQVRALCARLAANPFNTPAAEALLDLLLQDAPAVDLALERVMQAVVNESVSGGTQILDVLGGRRDTAPNARFVVGAAA